jgi:iron complex transport system ATP-binding protein
MTAVIEAENICVRASGRFLLQDVSVRINAGETVAVIGPNGAGKSTLLRALSGEHEVCRGVVRFAGRSLSSYAPQRIALRRAVLSQNVSVSFPFTVAEIVHMGSVAHEFRKSTSSIDAAIDAADLRGLESRLITTLSGGEQQRAHFARALLQLMTGESVEGPGLLLLDEPTASLDLRHQLAVLGVARACARRGHAVLAVLHDLNLAALFGDRVIVVDRGQIVADGVPRDVISKGLLADVFGLRGEASVVLRAGVPFVLPQTLRLEAPDAPMIASTE